MRKYLKGKDGKFKGSLPDPVSAPASQPRLPSIPNSTSPNSMLGISDLRGTAKLPYYNKIDSDEVKSMVETYLAIEYWSGPSDNDPNDEMFEPNSLERKYAEDKIVNKLSSPRNFSRATLENLIKKSNGNREKALDLLAREIYDSK